VHGDGPDTAWVTPPDSRLPVTSTCVLEQSVDTVWETLTDPAAVMWLLPKALYFIASPEPVNGSGELRGVWVDRVRKGVRRSSVWEVTRDEAARQVTYLERGRPDRSLRLSFQLSNEAEGTRVEISVAHAHPWWRWWETPLVGKPGQSALQGLEERLRSATRGEIPEPINGLSMTMAPGTGAKKQNHAIVISAAPRHVWTIVNDKDASLLPVPDRVASWRRVIDGVEFIFTFDRHTGDALNCSMARVIVDGPFRLTTVDAQGVEILRELLPKDSDCLLRTTYRWTALLKSKNIRRGAEHWLAQVKEIAERDSPERQEIAAHAPDA
jgi:hypothetical protein